MKKSTITATFKADIKKVWEVVTNNNKYLKKQQSLYIADLKKELGE